MLRSLPDIKTAQPVTLGQGHWITLEQLDYFDINGIKHTWERCVRKNTAAPLADAVDIQVILQTNTGPHILLVVQYRPAIEKYALEFPSGLIDPNETALDAAQRELREETGYEVDKTAFRLSTQSVCYEPGLTNSTCYVAHTTIDTTTISLPPKPSLEQDEWSLQTICLPLKNLMTHLVLLQDKHQLVIDSRVYSFASGLDLARMIL
ncbi:NUDIX hydrolase domain-like protein [Halteromyces radiatus]|uniref:NUDIX hydrolase domain-like protein n=1 Tax=Halteromyces radiatus TaxID=101107 RepID=UPI002220351C|nr:NUDIX hydrolase domain-like protein [Halteromyces radiatus]KAI8097255.1 NUDIX hydrolase domain-like protein [Halteromyces radiatus]